MNKKQNKEQKEDQSKQRHSYIKTPLTQFKDVIDEYWTEFDRTLYEYEHKISIEDLEIDERVIPLIRNLKKIDKWKSNLYILYLHYRRTSKLAKVLQVNSASLSVYISMIKKEIKC